MLIVGAVEQSIRAAVDVTSGRAGQRRDRSDVDALRIRNYRTDAGQGDVGHLGVEFDW
jgi:hypothetical protein